MFSLWISSTLYKLKQQNCWYNLFKKKLNMFRVVKMFIFLCICVWCICECEHAHSVEHVCRSDGSFFPHCLQWTDDRCLELIFSLLCFLFLGVLQASWPTNLGWFSSFHLSPPHSNSGITVGFYHIWLFYVCSGDFWVIRPAKHLTYGTILIAL